ncbi:MAG: phosphatidylglycerophosphatase A [Verrucomicrobia bacterium]|nr:phosphatidylglycerophosphatase A [Verrucomicrobiota bacterium]
MKLSDKLILFIAQGFGVGRIPFAPGTWGSVVGIGFFLFLVAFNDAWALLILPACGLLPAVFLCERAEQLLGEKDPGSVVLDEIMAVPLCFVFYCFNFKTFPPVSHFLTPQGAFELWLGFGLFRLFDIWKPWPVRQSQRLPGGWGVVVDDVLAAVYVNLVMVAAWAVMSWLG